MKNIRNEVKKMLQKMYTSFGINSLFYNQINKQSFSINNDTSVLKMSTFGTKKKD